MPSKNVLVLCTGNSARSILAEALLNELGGARVRALSAGSRPAGAVHPGAERLLRRRGIDASAFRSKSWTEFAQPGAPEIDIVITVCGNAAGEACPVFPGRAVRAHWGLPDPAAVTGSQSAQDAAFERTYELLRQRTQSFLSLPLETMGRDDLIRELDAIGQMEGAT